MITGELKSQVDRLWDAFWSGGISNPLEVIEQITYLLFIKRLDDLHTAKEAKANRLKKPIENPIFNSKQQELRWSRFKNEAAPQMYKIVSEKVFPFIKELKSDRADSTYQHHMKDARFTIPNAGVARKGRRHDRQDPDGGSGYQGRPLRIHAQQDRDGGTERTVSHTAAHHPFDG